MTGRNGWDFLNVVLSIVYVIVWVVSIFVGGWIRQLLLIVLLALVVLMVCRALSRNTYARRRESQWVEMQYHRIRSFFAEHRSSGAKNAAPNAPRTPRDREHIYRTCPACRAKLRLPKKRGKHSVCCPRCGTRFSVFVLFR